MFFLLSSLLSQFLLQSSLAFVIPQQYSHDTNENANYYLVPVQELVDPGEDGGEDNIENVNSPTGEEIIE